MKFRMPHIGMRIVKSAIGVLICFVIYLLRGKSGAPFYSALAVLWCIQNQTRNTLGNALQRTIGTFIGAFYGLIYILVKFYIFNTGDGILHYLIISLLLIPIIYTTVVIKQKKASYFSCVVFLSIVVNHLMDDNPYIFVLNRCLDTLIGIFVGLIINSVHFHGHRASDILFVVDMDGTMESSEGGITAYGKVAINNMLEDGINLTFTTLRTPAGFLEGMPSVKPRLPIIAMDGAILYDVYDNKYPKVYIISAEHANNVSKFIFERGFNLFTTVILEDMLIIYYKELKNIAETDIYRKMHKSPYRNYLCKDRPEEHPVVYMMCIDESSKIEKLVEGLYEIDAGRDFKILTYPSDDYKGYSYLKIYNKNASVKNMIDYLMDKYGTAQTISLSDNDRNTSDFLFDDSNRMVHKLHNMFYWKKETGKEHSHDYLYGDF